MLHGKYNNSQAVSSVFTKDQRKKYSMYFHLDVIKIKYFPWNFRGSKKRLKFGYGLEWEAGQDFMIVWGSALELDYIYK